MKRKIVHIDEEKCNGCGLCVPACHEGAIQIIDGKARLLDDKLCDGLGDCLGECPEGAILIEEREADPFDEEAVKAHLETLKAGDSSGESDSDALACGCPSSMVKTIEKDPAEKGDRVETEAGDVPSELRQWPVQLALLPPKAKFFQGANLLVAADCVPFAYGNFHRDFLKDHTVVVGCPKLDNAEAYYQKLTEIFKQNVINKVTIAIMEVPCCSAFKRIVEGAIQAAGKNIPVEVVVVSADGEIVKKERAEAV